MLYLICSWIRVDCNTNAGAMCSVAASGSTAESLHRSIEAFPGSCMVASASAGISGVCSVAGRVGVERLLEELPWSCGLFRIEPIARNAARKDVDKPKELTSTSLKKLKAIPGSEKTHVRANMAARRHFISQIYDGTYTVYAQVRKYPRVLYFGDHCTPMYTRPHNQESIE